MRSRNDSINFHLGINGEIGLKKKYMDAAKQSMQKPNFTFHPGFATSPVTPIAHWNRAAKTIKRIRYTGNLLSGVRGAKVPSDLPFASHPCTVP